MVDLSCKIGKLKLKNPVTVASGTFSCDMFEMLDASKLGAVITKTITLKPRAGNEPPRIAETPSGMLNAIGLENEGLDGLKKKWLPCLKNFETKIIASIAGETDAEILELAKEVSKIKGVDAVELNLSCPNVKTGMQFSQDSKLIQGVVGKIRKITDLTLIAKLTPNVTDIKEMAKAAEAAGADAVSLVNTYTAMGVDINTRKPLLGNVTGGLSGPAIRPMALKAVWDVYNAVDIPIIGMGGIMTGSDAIEFMICGASAVGIGTASFVNPKASLEIIDQIGYYMNTHNIKKISELTGSLKK